jgi:Ca2+-binding EF-hand superfamily protein
MYLTDSSVNEARMLAAELKLSLIEGFEKIPTDIHEHDLELHRMLRKIFDKIDVDGSGLIEIQELRNALACSDSFTEEDLLLA